MMEAYKTQEQIDADSKHFELLEAAKFLSFAESKEIDRRHRKYKQRAKNLAGVKGANKSALHYERLILTERLDAINKELGYGRLDDIAEGLGL